MNRNDSSLLRGVRVAAPCHESWDSMPGTERIRSCERCQHKVYNLSELTTVEAEALLRSSEGRLCIRFYRRADGTIMTKDCTVGATARRNKRVAQAVAGVAAAVGSAAAILRPQPSTFTSLPVIQSTPEPITAPIMGMRVAPAEMAEMAEMGDVASSNPKTLSSNH